MRKRKQDKEEATRTADAATATAYVGSNQTAEMEATSKTAPPPAPGNYFAPMTTDKQGDQYNSSPGVSPPPIYGQTQNGGQGQQQIGEMGTGTGHIGSPSSGFTELDTRQSPSELGSGFVATSELGTEERPKEVEGEGHLQHAPPPASVPSAPLQGGGDPAGRVSGPMGMGMGDSTGGINRPAVGRQRGMQHSQGVDMSGAPMSSDYRPHEMP